jgi:hypothetical protein
MEKENRQILYEDANNCVLFNITEAQRKEVIRKKTSPDLMNNLTMKFETEDGSLELDLRNVMIKN